MKHVPVIDVKPPLKLKVFTARASPLRDSLVSKLRLGVNKKGVTVIVA